MAISQNIRTGMKNKGLSVADLSFESRVPVATLYRLLSGEGNPKVGTIRRVSKALGVSAAQLIGDDDDAA